MAASIRIFQIPINKTSNSEPSFMKRFRRYSSIFQRNVMCELFGRKAILSTNSAHVSLETETLDEILRNNYVLPLEKTLKCCSNDHMPQEMTQKPRTIMFFTSYFRRDSGITAHRSSALSCVYFLAGRIFHPQTQLTFLTKE